MSPDKAIRGGPNGHSQECAPDAERSRGDGARRSPSAAMSATGSAIASPATAEARAIAAVWIGNTSTPLSTTAPASPWRAECGLRKVRLPMPTARTGPRATSAALALQERSGPRTLLGKMPITAPDAMQQPAFSGSISRPYVASSIARLPAAVAGKRYGRRCDPHPRSAPAP